MRLAHVPYLRCPETQAALTCEPDEMSGDHVIAGALVTATGRRYRIERGVPDFRHQAASARQAASERSFGLEWQVFRREGWDSRQVRERIHFYSYTGLVPSFLTGRKVLDAGCGNGRYAFIAAQSKAEIVIGADISDAAYVAFENTWAVPNILIIRADLAQLPLGEDLDVLYSIGVLHHTPDAAVSFDRLARHCRVGGLFSAYLYGRGNPVLRWTNHTLRNRIFSRLPQSAVGMLLRVPAALQEIVRRIPLLGPVLIAWVNKLVYWGNYHNMYDAYTAGFTSFHGPEEVEAWYHRNTFSCTISVQQQRTALYCIGQKVSDPDSIEAPRERVGSWKEMAYALFT